jgi:hypothetical protein
MFVAQHATAAVWVASHIAWPAAMEYRCDNAPAAACNPCTQVYFGGGSVAQWTVCHGTARCAVPEC